MSVKEQMTEALNLPKDLTLGAVILTITGKHEAYVENYTFDAEKNVIYYTVSDEAGDASNQFAYKITGTLTNNTDKEQSYIQIEYVLYDADGNQVGTALANTNHLKAGGTWKFEAMSTVSPDQVASWERSDVSGF